MHPQVLVIGAHGDLDGSTGRYKYWLADKLLAANSSSIWRGGGVVIFLDVPCVAHILNCISVKVPV